MNDIVTNHKPKILRQTISFDGTSESSQFLTRDMDKWVERTQPGSLVKTANDDKKVKLNHIPVDNQTGRNGIWFLSENGSYEILTQLRKSKARRFKAEVKKILKTIRRHCTYLTLVKLKEVMLNPDVLILLTENLKAEQEKSARLEAKIEADSAKVRFAEAVTAASATIRIGELAKILKQNGYPTGQTRLFAQLRAEGYLMKNAVGENIPTQKAMELGLFEIQESAIVTGTGKEFITKTTRVTGKGQQYFIDRYAPKGGLQ